MLSGMGSITLRSGRALPARYQFDVHRARYWVGYLIVETSQTDPSEFSHKVLLHCHEGVAVELAVTDWTDRHMAVVGRPFPALDRAA